MALLKDVFKKIRPEKNEYAQLENEPLLPTIKIPKDPVELAKPIVGYPTAPPVPKRIFPIPYQPQDVYKELKSQMKYNKNVMAELHDDIERLKNRVSFLEKEKVAMSQEIENSTWIKNHLFERVFKLEQRINDFELAERKNRAVKGKTVDKS